MPTARPRYQVTDTGSVREMLDTAASRLPDVRDRKALLLRLAEIGAAQLATERESEEAALRRQEQVLAARESVAHIDVDVLLSDAAWK